LENLPYILIALALSSAPFSVAVHTGVYRCVVTKESVAHSIVMGLFHIGLFAVGWLIGTTLSGALASLAFPFAVLMIAFIGFRLFRESFRTSSIHKIIADNELKLHLLIALAVSINAFLVGIALGLVGIDLSKQLVFLAFSIVAFSYAGSKFGGYGKVRAAQTAELTGGIILFIVAIGMVIRTLL
jgi:manganese efflux pump family protein